MEEQKPFLTGYWGNLEKIPEALSLIAFYFVAAFLLQKSTIVAGKMLSVI